MKALPNPVGWFEIHVEDMARAQTFYTAVFERGFEPLPSDDPHVQKMMFQGQADAPGIAGALIKHPMKQPSTEGALVYFSCVDCAVQSLRAEQLGGQVYKPKTAIGPHGFIAIIGDSEGNAIGLHSFA